MAAISRIWFAPTAIVPNTRELLPEPETPMKHGPSAFGNLDSHILEVVHPERSGRGSDRGYQPDAPLEGSQPVNTAMDNQTPGNHDIHPQTVASSPLRDWFSRGLLSGSSGQKLPTRPDRPPNQSTATTGQHC